MQTVRRVIAVAAATMVLASTQPVAAAPTIPLPGPSIPGIPGPELPPTPPVPVGEMTCWHGFVFGDFTDLDQDDETLRVYGISADDGDPIIEYPAFRAWGKWAVYLTTEHNQINLIAYDDDGHKVGYFPRWMMPDGSCVDL